MKIFWNTPIFGEREKELVCDVLNSGYVSEGPKTKELEEKLTKIVGTKHIIMTTSCTAALYLAVKADKIIRGYPEGEVIIPDLTFVATKNAVELAGLKLNIQDVDKDDSFLLSSHEPSKDTKIVIPVNLLGRESKLMFHHNLTYIYDNAGALGSNVPNGKVGCYSLQSNKLIGIGQGGFCATDYDEYAQVIREQKDFGRHLKDENNTVGFNFKFNDILAAITLGQLETLEERKDKLKYQYESYKLELSKYGKFIKFETDEIPLWIEFICKDNLERNALLDYLKDREIYCRKPWMAIEGLKNALYYSNHVIWLPNGQSLTKEQQLLVIKEIKGFYDGTK